MWNKKLKARMAAAAATAALTVSLMGMTAFAATGIVNTTDVNVRTTAGCLFSFWQWAITTVCMRYWVR